VSPSLPEVPELLAHLVQCPSVGGLGGNGEAAMASLLAHMLEPWADEVTVTEVVPGRPCLIARFDGLDITRAFAFEAHSDTVSVEGMSVDPFAATVRDGWLYGRGASDTKGPMAVQRSDTPGAPRRRLAPNSALRPSHPRHRQLFPAALSAEARYEE